MVLNNWWTFRLDAPKTRSDGNENNLAKKNGRLLKFVLCFVLFPKWFLFCVISINSFLFRISTFIANAQSNSVTNFDHNMHIYFNDDRIDLLMNVDPRAFQTNAIYLSIDICKMHRKTRVTTRWRVGTRGSICRRCVLHLVQIIAFVRQSNFK